MEILFALLWFLVEVIVNVVLEMALELCLEVVKAVLSAENVDPVLATLGYLLLGAMVGGFSTWFAPGRILEPGPVPGLSLALAPVVAGAVMETWGGFRRSRGYDTTNLATWYGGAALAFGFALVRYRLTV